MAYWKYNGYSFPALPEWAEEYAYVTIHDPNLGSSYLIATNEISIKKSNNITYGNWYDTYAVSGVKCIQDGSSWGAPAAISNQWILGQSPYMDGSYRARWSNKDIYCTYDDGTEYLGLAGSAPTDPETGEEIVWPPVTAPAMDHTALVQGWIVGKRLAGMRGKA